MSIIGGNNTIDPPAGGNSGETYDYCSNSDFPAFSEYRLQQLFIDEFLKEVDKDLKGRTACLGFEWLFKNPGVSLIDWMWRNPQRAVGRNQGIPSFIPGLFGPGENILPFWGLPDLDGDEESSRYQGWWYGRFNIRRSLFFNRRSILNRYRGVLKYIKDGCGNPIWNYDDAYEKLNLGGLFFDEYYKQVILCQRQLYTTDDEKNLKQFLATIDAFFDAMEDAAKDQYFWTQPLDWSKPKKPCKCLTYEDFVRRYLHPRLKDQRRIPPELPVFERPLPDGGNEEEPGEIVTPHKYDDTIPFVPFGGGELPGGNGIRSSGNNIPVKKVLRELWDDITKDNPCQQDCVSNKLSNP